MEYRFRNQEIICYTAQNILLYFGSNTLVTIKRTAIIHHMQFIIKSIIEVMPILKRFIHSLLLSKMIKHHIGR